jgi:hypothetical protein
MIRLRQAAPDLRGFKNLAGLQKTLKPHKENPMTPKQIQRLKDAHRDSDRPFFFEFDGIKYELRMITTLYENGGWRTRKFFTLWGAGRISARDKADAVCEELQELGLPVGTTPGDAHREYLMRMP